ncbi:MAG: DUF1343 domain-containing protein [Pyrinomonas sp.]|uniref:exo-beta-N-acetylmuramidase NamZ family protein n=1 Tax=Pyrinomonas sp. TaxID=2080306 RepID=UPI0033336433
MSRRRRTVLGVERLLEERAHLLRGARVGLVCNQASVDHELRHVADLFKEERGWRLTALFGPQHGIRGTEQDNMIETPHGVDKETGVPVYSLYSEVREPTAEMLSEVDVLVVDLQDVGCRIYTFIYTMMNCLRAARRYGKGVIVCDRPNPIGGVAVEGNMLERGHESFVGQYPLPTRHGMTVGELALMFNEEIGCDLEVVPMCGWGREVWFDQTDVPWVMPSPNMPTLETATVFSGTVHLEGTEMSEGRGTTRPFELVGAPYVEAARLARRLEGYGFEGVRFRACYFKPTFQKHAGRVCGGVQIHVTKREGFRPVEVGLAVVREVRAMYGEQFRWREPPYEYEHERNPFDVITGTTWVREALERGASIEELVARWRSATAGFAAERGRWLLY